jgi:hypothetical protein
MTTLSWLLYLADVSGSLNGTAFVFGMVGIVCIVTAVSFKFLVSQDAEGAQIYNALFIRYITKIFTFTVVCFVLAALLPNRQTVYTIAVVEYGAKISELPEMKEIYDEAVARLKRELSSDTKAE